jgi:hypothetical protein
LGDHDALVAGELVPTPLTQSLAAGDRALWEMPTDLAFPAGLQLNVTGSPDGPPDPAFVTAFLEQALAGATVQVPPDPGRRELEFAEVISRLWSGAGAAGPSQLSGAGAATASQRLDYVRDVGDWLRLIVLDLVRRGGGSGGLVQEGQPQWLEQQLAEAGERWVIVVTHHPLENVARGEQLVALLDRSPRVIATLAGHIHRNRIVARETAAGGYWMITTCSLIDFPQQSRALRLLATDDGGVALQTWMLDHVGDGSLGRISRELSHIDSGDGRARHLAGTHWDRNATLFRRAVR